MDILKAPRIRQAATAAILLLGPLACSNDSDPAASENKRHPAVSALQATERVGVVPGSILLSNGDRVARPLAGANGDVACEGSDGDLHDDADTLYYQKEVKLLKPMSQR